MGWERESEWVSEIGMLNDHWHRVVHGVDGPWGIELSCVELWVWRGKESVRDQGHRTCGGHCILLFLLCIPWELQSHLLSCLFFDPRDVCVSFAFSFLWCLVKLLANISRPIGIVTSHVKRIHIRLLRGTRTITREQWHVSQRERGRRERKTRLVNPYHTKIHSELLFFLFFFLFWRVASFALEGKFSSSILIVAIGWREIKKKNTHQTYDLKSQWSKNKFGSLKWQDPSSSMSVF